MKRFILILVVLLSFSALFADGIDWINDYDLAMEKASQTGQNVLVLLTAPSWCGYCQWMDENTFSDGEIINFVNQGFIPCIVTDKDADISRFEFGGYPTTQVFSPQGEKLAEGVGALDSSNFKSRFASFAKEALLQGGGNSDDPIKLYGRASSQRTRDLKSYFESSGIAYEFHDVEIPEERSEIKQAIEDFGWTGTIYLPIIMIGDLIYFPPN